MIAGEIISYVATALGGGVLTQIVNWRIDRKKAGVSLKADEIETMKKAMEDFYNPLIEQQNERITALNDEVQRLREEKQQQEERHLRQVELLQGQISDLYKMLGQKLTTNISDEKK